MRSRIAAIGVELEGGWTREGFPAGCALEHDGSVSISDLFGSYMKGEIPSPPLPMSEWEAWVRSHYPQVCNATCGLHTHLSFRSMLHYQWCMDPEFSKVLTKAVMAWAKASLPPKHYIWERLRGKNRYCLDGFLADQQARVASKGHSRYTKVNYCFLLHQTMEVRLLPMFENIPEERQMVATGRTKLPSGLPETEERVVRAARKGVDLAVEAIRVVLSTTEQFIRERGRRERPVEVVLPMDNQNEVAEEYRLII